MKRFWAAASLAVTVAACRESRPTDLGKALAFDANLIKEFSHYGKEKNYRKMREELAPNAQFDVAGKKVLSVDGKVFSDSIQSCSFDTNAVFSFGGEDKRSFVMTSWKCPDEHGHNREQDWTFFLGNGVIVGASDKPSVL